MKTFLVLLVLISTTSAAEVGSPDWIVASFFQAKEFPEKAKYCTGEMLQLLQMPSIGEIVTDSAIVNIRVLERKDSTIVYSISYSLESQSIDFSCYLKKVNNVWKIEAVRSLDVPGFFDQLLNECEGKSALTGAEDYACKNARLLTQSDEELKQFLKVNLSKFEEIVRLFQKHSTLTTVRDSSVYPTSDVVAYRLDKEVSRFVSALYLNYVSRFSGESPAINFNIGGIMGNSVGFLFVPDGSSPPPMSPSGYIYVEKILPHWYIYKTT